MASRNLGEVIRSVALLSIGTSAVQALSAISQTAFVLWLLPEDFGYWATAVSATIVLTGLLNFGEVNAFLTQKSSTLADSTRVAWRLNLILLACGLALAGIYAGQGQQTVAVLIALTSANLPIMGYSNLLVAGLVKYHRPMLAVHGQLFAALVRTAVGIGVAWSTGSAIAFAASMLCYSITMAAILPILDRERENGRRTVRRSMGLRQRAPWALQSVLQMLPTQADTFVASCLTSPTVLGVYFLSYQVTAGLASLISVSLYRSSIAALAALESEPRRAMAGRLMVCISSAVGILACLGAMFAGLVGGSLPPEWQAASPVIAILLASLPARFVITLADSLLTAEGKGWRSVRLNLVDTLGTSAVSLSAATGDMLVLAVAVVSWKLIFMLICLRFAYSGTLNRHVLLAGGLSLIVSSMVPVGIVIGGTRGTLLVVLALAVACGQGLVAIRRWRVRDDQETQMAW